MAGMSVLGSVDGGGMAAEAGPMPLPKATRDAAAVPRPIISVCLLLQTSWTLAWGDVSEADVETCNQEQTVIRGDRERCIFQTL